MCSTVRDRIAAIAKQRKQRLEQTVSAETVATSETDVDTSCDPAVTPTEGSWEFFIEYQLHVCFIICYPSAVLCGRCCIKHNNLCFLFHVCIVAHIAGDELSDVGGMESVQPEEEHHVNYDSDLDDDAVSVESSSDEDDEGESSEASDVESVSSDAESDSEEDDGSAYGTDSDDSVCAPAPVKRSKVVSSVVSEIQRQSIAPPSPAVPAKKALKPLMPGTFSAAAQFDLSLLTTETAATPVPGAITQLKAISIGMSAWTLHAK